MYVGRRCLGRRRPKIDRRAEILRVEPAGRRYAQGARRWIKARWICEQAHQELKEELGLDHFEGRSWIELHRHALIVMIAYAFLQSRRLKAARRKKRAGAPRPQPGMPAFRQAILNLFARPPSQGSAHYEKPITHNVDVRVLE